MQAAAPKPKAIRRAHPGQGVSMWHASKWPKQRSYVENGERGLGRDHLYSVAAITDAAGSVVERYRYSIYGERTVLAADGITTRAASLYGQQIGFTGRFLDKETGLWYYRTRMYSASLGRFMERMPWTTLMGSGQRTSYFLGKQRSKAILSAYAPILVPNWKEFAVMLLDDGYGGYHQGRYSLYDFNKDDPANRLEPFSGSTSSIQAAPPTVGDATLDATKEVLSDLAAAMADAAAYRKAAAALAAAIAALVVADILVNCDACIIGKACWLNGHVTRIPSEATIGGCSKMPGKNCCWCDPSGFGP